MPYNEEGVYFNGLVTYRSDAIVGYSVLTGMLLIVAASLFFGLKKHRNTKK